MKCDESEKNVVMGDITLGNTLFVELGMTVVSDQPLTDESRNGLSFSLSQFFSIRTEKYRIKQICVF